jgi:membrane protease YdiL (CAAX protease family)
LVGVLFAFLVVRTGRLGPAIWAHVAFNTITVVALGLKR